MPTKKQRRRREKERRHEFEDAFYDDDGNEITAEEYEALTGGPASATAAAATSGKRAAAQPAGRGRAARTVPPPSWKRVAKRGLLFAPLMYLTMYFLDPGQAAQNYVAMTAYLLALFIPFSYLLDRMMYRRFARQRERSR
jgi:hypothetical protein